MKTKETKPMKKCVGLGCGKLHNRKGPQCKECYKEMKRLEKLMMFFS